MFSRLRSVSNTLKHIRKCSNLPAVVKRPGGDQCTSPHFRVTVLNGDTNTGLYTCLALKQNPGISELNIHVSSRTASFANDIKYIPGRANVNIFYGEAQIESSLKEANLALVISKTCTKDSATNEDVFSSAEGFLRDAANACSFACPFAVIVVDAAPLNYTVPFFSGVFAQHGAINTCRVLGNMNVHCLRAQTYLARKLNLDPHSLADLVVVGGGTPETIVPVISYIEPEGFPLLTDPMEMIQEIKQLEKVDKLHFNIQDGAIVRSRGLTKLASAILSGMSGKKVKGCAFVRTSDPLGVKYFSVPVEFGSCGVEKNLGLPKLSQAELESLDEAIIILSEEIALGEKHIPPPWDFPVAHLPAKTTDVHTKVECQPPNSKQFSF